VKQNVDGINQLNAGGVTFSKFATTRKM